MTGATEGGRQHMGMIADWPSLAACRNGDPDALFVQGAEQNVAKRICRGCPVRYECLADALDNRIEFGVWGGMTERERRALLRRHPKVDELAPDVRGRDQAEGSGAGRELTRTLAALVPANNTPISRSPSMSWTSTGCAATTATETSGWAWRELVEHGLLPVGPCHHRGVHQQHVGRDRVLGPQPFAGRGRRSAPSISSVAAWCTRLSTSPASPICCDAEPTGEVPRLPDRVRLRAPPPPGTPSPGACSTR